jgi:hypothetical protein
VTTPSPNHVSSLEFLRWWLPSGPWCLAAIHPDERDRKDYIKARIFKASEGDAVLEWLKQHADHNLYYTANLAKPRDQWPKRKDSTDRPTREALAAMVCLHADIDPRAGEDVAAEQARIAALLSTPRPRDLPPPSLIVFTGGGYQVLWRLKEPVPIKDLAHAEDLSRYNLQIRNLLDGDSAQDLSRILRLPGTVNWPNKLKREKKKRQPALAYIVEQHLTRLYELREFIQAPEVQDKPSTGARTAAGGQKRKVRAAAIEAGGNIRRLTSVDELPDSVPLSLKVIIVQGDNPDDFTQFNGDRSKAVWYTTCELVRQKVPDEMIFSVLTDPGFGISGHVLDQPRAEKYALRQIERAHEFALDPDLKGMNDRYAVIANFGGRCRVIEEAWDERLKRSTLTSMTFDDFRNAWLHQRKEIAKDETMPLAEWWLRNPNRRQYERVVFRPNEDEDVDDCYNLWRGFGVEPVPGDCSLFLEHIRTTLCGNDEDCYLYVLRWMARAVQFPGETGQVALVLKGRMGTGKSFFARTFGRLFGRHYLAVADGKRLVSNFNSHLRDCVLLFADEAFYAGDKKHESILKALITEDVLAIEAKGKDIEMGSNCLHVIMASNEDWAVPASMDDRRFHVMDVKDDQRNAHAHFQRIQEQMESGGYCALLDQLLKMDIRTFNVRQRPETKALGAEKLMSLGPVEAYWYECLRAGDLCLLDTKTSGWPERVPRSQVFDEVKRRLPPQSRLNNISLGMTFAAKLLPPGVGDRDVRIPGTLVWRDHQGNERTVTNTPAWELPPLRVCREWWVKRFGPPQAPWPEEDEHATSSIPDGLGDVPF